jgi:hypothetical protein
MFKAAPEKPFDRIPCESQNEGVRNDRWNQGQYDHHFDILGKLVRPSVRKGLVLFDDGGGDRPKEDPAENAAEASPEDYALECHASSDRQEVCVLLSTNRDGGRRRAF